VSPRLVVSNSVVAVGEELESRQRLPLEPLTAVPMRLSQSLVHGDGMFLLEARQIGPSK